MGAINEYKCPVCTYTCDVAGGSDSGMKILTETCVCTNCKILLDIQWLKTEIEELNYLNSQRLPPLPLKPKLTFIQILLGKKLDLNEYNKNYEEFQNAANKASKDLIFRLIKEHSCPKCDGFYLEKWNEKHPCPKCNSKMKLNILWKVMFD